MGQDSFTDMCTRNKNCREKDIHTDVATLKDSEDVSLELIVNICISKEEKKLHKDIQQPKTEILHLQTKNLELEQKITVYLKFKFP